MGRKKKYSPQTQHQIRQEAKALAQIKDEATALAALRTELRTKIWELTNGFENIVTQAIKDSEDIEAGPRVRANARRWLCEYCLGPPAKSVNITGTVESNHTLSLEDIITQARGIPVQPFDVIEVTPRISHAVGAS